MDWSGPSAAGEGDGRRDGGGRIFSGDFDCRFGDGREDGVQVHHLMGVVGQQVGGLLGGDDDDGRAIEPGVGHTGHRIRRARAEGSQYAADTAGRAGVGVGGKDCAGFVVHQFKADAPLAHSFQHGHHFAAGHTENEIDPGGVEGFGEGLGGCGHRILGIRYWVGLLVG